MIKTCPRCNQDFLTEADPYFVLPILNEVLCMSCGKKECSIFPELKKSVEEVVPCSKNCANFHNISTDFCLDGCCNDVYNCPCERFELEEK